MLTNEQTDFILSSTANYIEVGHGDTLQPYFEKILTDIDYYIDTGQGYNRFIIPACHGVGKTFTLARFGDACMGRFNEVKIVSTAPSHRQVHDLLWKEWATAYQNKLTELKRGKLNETQFWVNSETFARGFSPPKTVQKEAGQGTDSAFQGYHAKFLLVVLFDEGVGIAQQFWKQAEGLLTSGHRVIFIAIGNPTSRNCEFYKKTQDRMWKTYPISCFDSPNLKAAGIQSV